MIRTSILAVLMFTAGIAFGRQSISCTFSNDGKTYEAFFSNEEATDLYYQIGSLQAEEKRRKERAQELRQRMCPSRCGVPVPCGQSYPGGFQCP